MDILSTIGNTPLVELPSFNANRIYAKLEYFNPTGSVKDRAALYMIRGAIDRGELEPGGSVIEPTSGNTGIGLALIGKAMGYRVTLSMPENMSSERVAMIRALGAEVVLTDKARGMDGAVAKAQELAAECGGYIPMQFTNLDNKRAHYETTASEIFNAVSADAIIAGVGSGGTLMGIKQYAIDNGINAKAIAVQPYESPLLSGGTPGAHGIQGIGANFVPKLYDRNLVDKVLSINTVQAKHGAAELAKCGVMGGFSAGANYMAALEYAASVSGQNIVFIVPDTALRYLSMNIYD